MRLLLMTYVGSDVQLVTIVDPHIKRVDSLYVYKEGKELDVLQKTSDGREFEGWCWTGSSSWPDWFNPKSWDWWTGMFTFEKFVGSKKNLFIWNDMNEVSPTWRMGERNQGR